jgi:P22 coat protein - gene protein 5
MPNTFNAELMPRIYAMAVQALRQRTSVLQYIRKEPLGSMLDPASKGRTINIPIPSSMTDATDVVPGSVYYSGEDITPTFAQITLDQWKRKGFAVTDAEWSYIVNGVVDGQFRVCIDKLAKSVVSHIFNNYRAVANYVGTAGTTPFASSTADAQNARRFLNVSGAPQEDRTIILNADAEANALGLGVFQQYLQRGDTEAFREARLGRALGFDWDLDLYVPTHTSTALSAGAATVNGSHNAGVTSVSIAKATNSSPLVRGDIISFAGDSQTYVVTANTTLAVGNTSVPIFPALQVARAGGEAVTLRASHVVNLAFQRDAFAFASRPLDDVSVTSGNTIMAMPDPETGLVLRMEVSRQNKQTLIDFDILFGSTCVDPNRACRIAG